MTKEIENFLMETCILGTGAYRVSLTVVEIMAKHGYRCISMRGDALLLCPEHPVRLRKYQHTFVPLTEEKNTLFSIYQDLEKLTQDCMKHWKKLKMDWSLTTGGTVIVEISVDLK